MREVNTHSFSSLDFLQVGRSSSVAIGKANRGIKRQNFAKQFAFNKWWSFVILFLLSLSVNAQNVSVTATAGAGLGGAGYATLGEALDSVNSGYFQGAVSITVNANTTEGARLDSIKYSGLGNANYTSINIKPATGVTATISSSNPGAILKLVGADNVTIDGSNTSGGTSRDLTFINTSTSGNNTGIWLGSLPTGYNGAGSSNGANNNTIKNVVITLASRVTSNAGIFSGLGNTNSQLGTGVAANNSNTFSNNSISKANYGIIILGFTTSPYDASNTISGNNIDSCRSNGLYLSNMSGYNVNDNILNTISNLPSSTTTIYGILVTGAHLNGNIYKNKILYVRQNNTTGANISSRGISLNNSNNASNVAVYNNFINDVSAYGAANTLSVIGLYASVGGGYKIYNNTVHLITDPIFTSCFVVTFATGNLTGTVDIRNNTFSGNITFGSTSASQFKNYCYYFLGTAANGCLPYASLFTAFDNNNFYTNGTTLASTNFTSTGAMGTLAALQSEFSNNANSVNVLPTFVSPTTGDLHLSAVTANAALSNSGVPLTGTLTTDIDGATRSIYFPDMGADEFIYIPKINSISTSACAGGTVTITGADFTGASSVNLAGANASGYNVVSTSQITATVAGGYTSPVSGVVTVSNGNGTGTSAASLLRYAPGTYTSKSLSTGSTGDQVIITGSNLNGASAVTFGGVSASYSVTNATQIVTTVPSVSNGSVAVAITDTCGNSVNAGSFTVVTANPCSTPSTQPTSFVASSISTTALNGSFAAASGSPSGYVVVYSTSALAATPQDGTTYTAGGSLGGGTIKQVSASTNLSLSGLAGNTAYIVTIFAYNGGGCTGGPLYNITSPLVYNFTTCSDVPTSVVATPTVVGTNNTINFSWGIPAGGTQNSLSYIIDVTTDAGYSTPVAGSPFTATALSQVVNGLNFSTKYYYRIRSYNGCYSNYVSGNATTLCGAGTVLPYSQNFDAVITPALPSCWTVLDNNGDGFKWYTSVPFQASGNSAPTVLRFNSSGPTQNADDWAFTPGFNLTGGVSYTLSFLKAAYTSTGDNLVVKWGTAPSVAGMTGGVLWSQSGISNTVFDYNYGTFTPLNSGTYYFGFYTNSPYYHSTTDFSGGYQLYVDNVLLQTTPAAPAAPTSLTVASVTSSSANLTWTQNTTNLVGFNIYSSLDGTNWDLANTIYTPSTTSYTVSNLVSSTAYSFKVVSFGPGGQNTSNIANGTTNACSGYTTNTWIGALNPGAVADWATGANWSAGHQPTSCENVVINSVLPITTTTYIGLNNNITVHDLTISATNTGTALQRLYIYTDVYNLTVNGNLSINSTRTANTSVTGDYVLLAGGLGTTTVNGTANIGTSGNRAGMVGSDGSGLSNLIYKGDLTFGPVAQFNFANLMNFVFDAPVSQTVNLNSTVTSTSSTYGMGSVIIGSTNSPIVTFTDTLATNSSIARITDGLTINSGSTLIIDTATSLNRTAFGGTFTMGNNSTLKVRGYTGGVAGSNFPLNFSTFSVAANSKIEYSGTVAQTVSSAPPYGNLVVNNSSSVTLNGNTTVNGSLAFITGKLNTGNYTLTLATAATLTGASSSSYVVGKLGKTIGTSTSSKLFEIGDATNYTPANITFNGGATNNTGVIILNTTTGAHPALGYLRSGISTSKYLNRYFTATNIGVTGYTSITPSFTYATGDIVGTANNSNFIVVDSTYGGGWASLTSSNPTGSSTTASNVNFVQPITADFVIGEIDPAPAPTVNLASPTSACEGSTYVITGTNFYAVTGVAIGSSNVPVFTVNSPTKITITIPVGAGNGALAVTNATNTGVSANTLITNSQPQTTVSVASQTICSGDSIATIAVGNSANLSGTTYAWTRIGTIAGGNNATSGTSDISGTLINGVTIPVTATYSVVATTNGCVGTTAMATVTVKASPGTVSVNPTSANICQTVAQPLVAAYTAATGTSVQNSGVISLAITDGNQSGISTVLNVSDVPSGAIITGIDVSVDATHPNNSDLIFNLTAPNGKTLNIINLDGFGGKDFYHTVISSNGTDVLPVDVKTDSITGTWAADFGFGVGSLAYPSNALSWSQLYTIPNGNWRLSVRDNVTGNAGTLKNYALTIYYTLSPTFSWSPSAGLYTDAGFTPYTGGSQQTVYAKNSAGNYTYNATISFNGCTVKSTDATVAISATPIATSTPSSQTVCSSVAITSIVLGTSNGVANTTFDWTRDNTTGVTGINASGSGDISGTLVNTTSSPITVTFTITPTGPGASACPGSSITATVTVNPNPIATVAPLTQNVCSGSPITALTFGTTNSVSGTGYTWSRDNTSNATGIAASGNSFVSGTLTNTGGTTTVTFTVTAVGPGTSGCAGGSTATATVVVYNPATKYSITGGGNYCSPGSGVQLGLTNSQTGYNYQLVNGSTVGSTFSGTTGSPINFGYQSIAGTYTATATNAGCSTTMNGSATITATTTVTPSVTLVSSSTTACAGTNVSFFAVKTNAGTNPTFNFLVNGVSKQNGTSDAYITSTLPDGAVVSCIMTTSNVCQTSATSTSNNITMTITGGATLAAPAAVTGVTTQCTIGGVTYLHDATPNGTWNSSNPSVATIDYNGRVVALSNGVTVISYVISGLNGCTNSNSVQYLVAQQTTPNAITGLTSLCKGSNVTLTNTTPGGTWSSGNAYATIGTVSGSTAIINGVNAGTAVIYYTVSQSTCSKSVSYNVVVNAPPAIPSISYAGGTQNPQIGANGGFCINKSFSVVGRPLTVAGVGTGTWISGDTLVMKVGASSGAVQLLGLGLATLTYKYTNANGCSTNKTITGTVVNCPGHRGNEFVTSKPDMDFTLYPNPAKNTVGITAQFVENGGQIIVTDLFGKQVRVQTLSLGTNQVDVSNLSKGFYLVNVITNEGKKTKKLIIE